MNTGLIIGENSIVQLVLVGYIAVVLVSLIGGFVFHKTTGSLENVLKGPALPLATVLVIVATTTLLALVGIVKENTISAIFGGIVGYVLGGLNKREN